MKSSLIQLAESPWLPDSLLRFGIRRLLAKTATRARTADPATLQDDIRKWVSTLKQSPVAVHTDAANKQHYELPPAFFEPILGNNWKYSSAYYPTASTTLDQAEAAMLDITCERARLRDGQDILELGCGWGSLTVWMAKKYPNSRITAISNSTPQRETILTRCDLLGLDNVTIHTADMNEFQPDGQFDRVVSVEMFEHLRNYDTVMSRVNGWLRPGGCLFVHIFTHRVLAYPFETEGEINWMGRHFFTGGQMPSAHLLFYFQEQLRLEDHWQVNGTHYARTLRAWLDRMDAKRATLFPIVSRTYGEHQAATWWQRWRIFFIACEELFGYDKGREWFVSHYRFRKPD